MIPKLSISQPVLITMLMSALVVFGLLSYTKLPLDLLPDVSFPLVAVSTVYPGASADDVETSITKPIEEAVSSLNGVQTVNSTSLENVSQVTIQFTLDTECAGRRAERAGKDQRDPGHVPRGGAEPDGAAF